MGKENNLSDFLIDIANAIRDREGISGLINPQDFSTIIRGGVPSGYLLIEYIESNGAQYIDSGFKPNQDTRVLAEMEVSVSSSTNWAFGARTSGTSNYYGFAASQSGHYTSGYNNGDTSISESYNQSGKFTIDKNKNITNINGVNVSERSYASFSCPYNMAICACNTKGTISYGRTKVYYFKIYDNGNLVRDFVPCKNPSGIYGLYDKVNKQFYGSASGTPFTGA